MNKTFLLTFIIVLLGFFRISAQTPDNSNPKDPFFAPKSQQEQASKVQHIHSDESGVKPDQYEGNLVFSGNVKFEHQGSVLTADKVVLYQKENFLKAIGNVVLLNADGTRITAEEMEYDGNTERGIARKTSCLPIQNKPSKQKHFITIVSQIPLILTQAEQFRMVKISCTPSLQLIM